jgi:NAD(P)-dependent dehydrogenase (short-subunit alcohol dehydrogenase family)
VTEGHARGHRCLEHGRVERVNSDERDLSGRVALVAGASRGAGKAIAIELAAHGASVYLSGRTTDTEESDEHRPESLDAAVATIRGAGDRAFAIRTDHSGEDDVRALIDHIRSNEGRLDILVDALWGGERFIDWDTPIWKIPPARGLQLLGAALTTHLITAHFALGLMIEHPGSLLVEITDGTADYNGANYRSNAYYDVSKTALSRLAFGLAEELAPLGGTAVALTPGWMRTEAMLDLFGVTEATWQDATAKDPHFAITESPVFVARAVAAIAGDPRRDRWAGRSISSIDAARDYGFTDVDGSMPDSWQYNIDIKDRGLPPNVRGYR